MVETSAADVDASRGASVVRDGGITLEIRGALPRLLRKHELGSVIASLFEGTEAVDVVHHAGSRHDGLAVGYVVEGAISLEQRGRSVEVRPRGLVVYGGAAPFRLRSTGPHRFLVTRVPPQRLNVHRDDRWAIVARDLSAHCSATACASTLASLVDGPVALSPVSSHHLGDAVIAFLHAMIADTSGTSPAGRSTALYRRMTEWLDARITEHDLSAEVIAAEHFVSARYVRRVFADHGTTVSSYVRRRRLAKARDTLLDPRNGSSTVATVAASTGFRDPTVFGRAFVREFGRTPHSLRRTAERCADS